MKNILFLVFVMMLLSVGIVFAADASKEGTEVSFEDYLSKLASLDVDKQTEIVDQFTDQAKADFFKEGSSYNYQGGSKKVLSDEDKANFLKSLKKEARQKFLEGAIGNGNGLSKEFKFNLPQKDENQPKSFEYNQGVLIMKGIKGKDYEIPVKNIPKNIKEISFVGIEGSSGFAVMYTHNDGGRAFLQSGVLQDFEGKGKWSVFENGKEIIEEINFNKDKGGIFMRGKPNDVGSEKFKNGNYIWGTKDGSYYKDSFGNLVSFSKNDIEVQGNPGMRCGFSVSESEKRFNVRGAFGREEVLTHVINQNDVILDFSGNNKISGNVIGIGVSNSGTREIIVGSPGIRNVNIVNLETNGKFVVKGHESVKGIVQISQGQNVLKILGEKRMVETNKGGVSYSGSPGVQGGRGRVGDGWYSGGSSQSSQGGGSQGSGYSSGVKEVQDQMGARAPSPAPFKCPGGDCSQCPNQDSCENGVCLDGCG